MSVTTPELALLIPVYNEQAAILPVLREWREALSRSVGAGKFRILVIDDGSTDGTPSVLGGLDWPELQVHRHTNRGHGQSCLAGYLEVEKAGIPYVFQIDSDGQCDPVFFPKIWELRDDEVSIYGRRTSRDDGQARRLISSVLRFSLRLARGSRLNDANVPYRLYRSDRAAAAARRVPADFSLANIAVALLLEPEGFREIPIHFRDRIGGEPTVRWWGFATKAIQLHRSLRRLGR